MVTFGNRLWSMTNLGKYGTRITGPNPLAEQRPTPMPLITTDGFIPVETVLTNSESKFPFLVPYGSRPAGEGRVYK